MSNERYVEHLLADAERMATALAADAGAPVAACPGWDVARVVRHTGGIHRWAHHCVLHGEPPADSSALRPADDADLGTWLREGAADLGETLLGVEPDAPTWHPFPVAKVAGVWPRRQALETLVHRWDAEHAVGSTTPLDPDLASDGIDEYFEVGVPRLIERDGVSLPTGSLHVHCTDVEGEWLVRIVDGEYDLVRAHEKGDAALRGPAAELLLTLWGREADATQLGVVGDEAVAAAWTSIHGM